MEKSNQIRRKRERDQFESHFSLGDAIVNFIKINNCTIKDAVTHFRSQRLCTDRTLRAAEKTARAFPPSERNPSVGFTKHQALAEVSRKNVQATIPHSDAEWRLALREALIVIREQECKVNALNSSKLSNDISAKSIVESCLEKIKFF